MTDTPTQKASEALGLWEPKRSLTLDVARRHSRNIRILRLLLGLAALTLIGLLIWQFTQTSDPIVEDADVTDSVKMINPRYSGRTEDGLPFYLTAAEAVRKMSDDKTVNLVDPVLHFFREQGADESQIVAVSGKYDDEKKILILETAVDLSTDDGVKCLTTHAVIYARTKIVKGEKPIQCSGDFGTINGKGYEILDNYRTFVFKDGMNALLKQDDNPPAEDAP